MIAFVLCGLFASIGALFLTMQATSGDPRIGDPFTLNSIASVALGGALLSGGRASVAASVAGALVLGTLPNVLFLAGVSTYWQFIVAGTVLVLAVAVSEITRRGSTRGRVIADLDVSNDVPQPLASGDEPRRHAWLDHVVAHWRGWLPYVLAVAIYGVAVWISPSYADMRQLGTLLVLAAMLGIVAIGQTLVMLIGGIDLSVSAVITFVNLVVAATVAGNDGRIWLAVMLAVAIGLLVGVVNGVLIHVLRLPDIIMTLASFTILTGVALLYSGGSPKGSSSPLLGKAANGRLWDFLPYSMILWIVLSAIVIFVLRRTAPGRRVYAVGLNRTASRYAGVRVGWTVIGLYAASGVCAAIVGVLITGYTGSSYFGSGDEYQLGSIAAVVVGGTSIYGGRGGYGGTIAGAPDPRLLREHPADHRHRRRRSADRLRGAHPRAAHRLRPRLQPAPRHRPQLRLDRPPRPRGNCEPRTPRSASTAHRSVSGGRR